MEPLFGQNCQDLHAVGVKAILCHLGLIHSSLAPHLPCPHTSPSPTQGQNSGSTPCLYLSKTHPVMIVMTMMMTRRKKDNKKKMLNENKCIFFKMLFFLDHNS